MKWSSQVTSTQHDLSSIRDAFSSSRYLFLHTTGLIILGVALKVLERQDVVVVHPAIHLQCV